MCAILAPLVNSYKRLVPPRGAGPRDLGQDQPLGADPRAADDAGPPGGNADRAALPDPSCNPYLAFAVMLAARLDGIRRKLTPPRLVEENLYHFDDQMMAKYAVGSLPGRSRRRSTSWRPTT